MNRFIVTRCSPLYKKTEQPSWTRSLNRFWCMFRCCVHHFWNKKKPKHTSCFISFLPLTSRAFHPEIGIKKRNKTFTYCFKLRRIYHIFVHLSIGLQNFVNFPLYFSHYSQSIRYSQRIKYDTLFIVLIRRLDSTTWYHTNHSLKLCFVRT